MQAKVPTALAALCNLAIDTHKHDKTKLGQTTYCFLAHHAHLSRLLF